MCDEKPLADQKPPDPPAYIDVGQTGMTLRDFFACHALSPLLNHQEAAKRAYAIADALLAERAKR